MTSQKQIIANQKNAKKAGVKTDQGKEIVKHNALKHGLLAKETIITTGDGQESKKDFDSLITGLNDHYTPTGTIERILVEKIAVCYWRMRRANRYEVGLIREQLDTYKESLIDKYNKKSYYNDMKRPEKLSSEIKELESVIKETKLIFKSLEKMIKEKKELKDLYADKWFLGWHYLALYADEMNELNDDWEDKTPKEIHGLIKESEHNPDITGFEWRLQIKLNDNERKLETLKTELREVELMLDREPLVNGLLPGNELNLLVRYETAIEKQFYKALSELERLQRIRGGEFIPPPINLEVNSN